MHVVVNHEICEGHGKCQLAAPEVFEVRDDDRSYVLVEEVGDALRGKVERAIRLCPRQAISWAEGAVGVTASASETPNEETISEPADATQDASGAPSEEFRDSF